MDEVYIYVAIVSVTVLLIAGLVFAWHRGRERRRRVVIAWMTVARTIGGTFVAGSKRPYNFGDDMAITAKVDGVSLLVTVPADPRGVAELESLGQDNATAFVPRYAVIFATTSAPSAVALAVFPDVMPDVVRRRSQDVEIGDKEFDRAFVVKATDEVFARAWLNSKVRERISATTEYGFQLHDGMVVGQRFVPGIPDDPVALENAIRAVAAFADGRRRVVRQFRRLAKRLGGRARKKRRRWARVEAKVDDVHVAVDTVVKDGAHFNVATADVPHGGKLCPFVIGKSSLVLSRDLPSAEIAGLPKGFTAWGAVDEKAAAQVTTKELAQMAELRPAKVQVDKYEVSVFLDGICPSVTKMESAARLAAAISGRAYVGAERQGSPRIEA